MGGPIDPPGTMAPELSVRSVVPWRKSRLEPLEDLVSLTKRYIEDDDILVGVGFGFAFLLRLSFVMIHPTFVTVFISFEK